MDLLERRRVVRRASARPSGHVRHRIGTLALPALLRAARAPPRASTVTASPRSLPTKTATTTTSGSSGSASSASMRRYSGGPVPAMPMLWTGAASARSQTVV